MALVMNGVVIPTNIANAFKFNGNNVTQVIMNGTTVWTQSLFSATWSGNSVSAFNTTYSGGILTSGSSYRAYWKAGTNLYYGAWLSANSGGLGNGVSSAYSGVTVFNRITTTPSTFQGFSYDVTYPLMGFTTDNGFSGSSIITPTNTLIHYTGYVSSGGLMRAEFRNTSGGTIGTPGDFISLT